MVDVVACADRLLLPCCCCCRLLLLSPAAVASVSVLLLLLFLPFLLLLLLVPLWCWQWCSGALVPVVMRVLSLFVGLNGQANAGIRLRRGRQARRRLVNTKHVRTSRKQLIDWPICLTRAQDQVRQKVLREVLPSSQRCASHHTIYK